MSEELVMAGKVAVVTGGSRGIGEAVAAAFAREGARLVVAARTEPELRRAAERLRGLGAEIRWVSADVSQAGDADRIVQTALRAFSQVDVLVNAAGVYGPIGPMWDVDASAWVQAIQVNLCGTFFCCRAVLPHMIERRQGKIVNFSGGGAASPLPRFTAYGVSKAAVVRLTETLAEEVKEFNIQVNAIAPGAVDTRLQDAVIAAGERAGALLTRIRKLRDTGEGGVPRELPASLAVFLASPRSGALTGKLIAAPYDAWTSWDADRIATLMTSPWLTLRRLDHATLRPLLDTIADDAR